MKAPLKETRKQYEKRRKQHPNHCIPCGSRRLTQWVYDPLKDCMRRFCRDCMWMDFRLAKPSERR